MVTDTNSRNSNRQSELNFADLRVSGIHIFDKLGSGAFGDVYRGEWDVGLLQLSIYSIRVNLLL